MPLEVWGTYSVQDHIHPGALITDVLLYDRLVIPVPPAEEIETWQQAGWDPEAQRTTLSILGQDLVRAIPWSRPQREAFRTRLLEQTAIGEARARARDRFATANAVAFDAQNITLAKKQNPSVDPMHVTRLVLADYTDQKRDREFFDQHPDVYVEAVAAYPTHAQFAEEVPLRVIEPNSTGQASVSESHEQHDGLAGVFGWEFFVPADTTLSTEDLLAKAVDLAHREHFRRARADFHEWRREVLKFHGTPQTARADMERRIDQYQAETARVRGKTALVRGFAVAGIAVSLGSSLIFPPLSVLGGFIALASFGASLLPGEAPPRETRPGAMFADARRQFGWHPSD